MSDQEGDPAVTEPADGKRLRDAWQSLSETSPGESAGTPEVEDAAIWRAVASEGSVDEREAIVDHIAKDPAAAESWRLAQELQRELVDVEPGWRGVPVTPLWRRRWLATAAALLLAVGLGLVTRIGNPPHDPSDEPVFRDPEAMQLLSLISEDVPQARDTVRLRWSDVGEDVRYTVRILGSDLEPISVHRELTSTDVQIPPERLSEVAAGERLLWQVEARWPDGRTLVSSTFFLELTPALPRSTPPDLPQ